MANGDKPKRGHGEGTIQERRRKDGSVYFMGQVMLGYKPDGKPNRRTVYGKSRTEARKKLDALKADFAEGTLTAPTKSTVKDYLVGEDGKTGWLETHRRFGGKSGDGLRPNTYRDYKSMVHKHIIPEIGSVRLQSLTPTHLERLYTAILNKGLSMRQAQRAHQVLRTALEAAVEKDMLKRNPCDRVPKKPRVSYRAEDRPRLLRSDTGRVLAEVKGSMYYMPFLLAMSAGLRRGEILGLRWKNVNLDEGVIYVREQLQLDEDNKLTLEPLKTHAAMRDIPIPADVVAALKKHRAGQKVVNLEGFVCTNTRGNHLQLGDLDHRWGEIRKKLGLDPKMTLHDLRGSWVTWLAEKKVDLKTASTLAGHADERVTLAIYQSVTKEMKREAAQAMEGITKLAEEG